MSTRGESAVSEQIRALKLSSEQMQIMRKIVDDILTDTYITLLYALDGAASLYGDQQVYRIQNEDGEIISDCGELEAAAYEAFCED